MSRIAAYRLAFLLLLAPLIAGILSDCLHCAPPVSVVVCLLCCFGRLCWSRKVVCRPVMKLPESLIHGALQSERSRTAGSRHKILRGLQAKVWVCRGRSGTANGQSKSRLPIGAFELLFTTFRRTTSSPKDNNTFHTSGQPPDLQVHLLSASSGHCQSAGRLSGCWHRDLRRDSWYVSF